MRPIVVVTALVFAAPLWAGPPVAPAPPPPAATTPPAAPAPTTTTAPAPAAKPTMAVMPFRVAELAANEVSRLNLQMSSRARSRGGYDVPDANTMNQLVDASASLGVDCDVAAVECGVKLGKIADVQFVLLGHATGGLDKRVGVDVRIIDVKAGTEQRRASALLPSEPDQQADAMNAFCDGLFSTAPQVDLVLEAEPPGSEVLVDGTPRGLAPLKEPIKELAPGDHFVVVQKKGYVPYRSRLSIAIGEQAKLQVGLAIDPEALHTGPTTAQIAIPFLVAGGGVLMVGGGVVAAVFGYQPYATYQGGVDRVNNVHASEKSGLTPDDVDNITQGHQAAEQGKQDWDQWGQATVVSGVVAGVIGLGAAIGGTIWGMQLLDEADKDQAANVAAKNGAAKSTGATTTSQ